jgi:hypothetical protein
VSAVAELALADAPALVTELPGPKARALVERDARGHQPFAPARLPARAGPGVGVRRRGRRRQPPARLQCRDRGDLDRSLPSRRGGGDPAAGRRAPPLLGLGLPPAGVRRPLRTARGTVPGRRGGPRLPHELRHGGGRGSDQARALAHPPAVRDRLLRLLPRALVRQRLADREQGSLPGALRPAPPRRAPRAVRGLLSAESRGVGLGLPDGGLPRGRPLRAARRAGGGGGGRRRADPGRGRLRRASARLARRVAAALRPARDPARPGRGAERDRAHRPHVGDRARGRRARRARGGQGHRERDAARRDARTRGVGDLDAGHARLDLRRQSGVVRGGARDAAPGGRGSRRPRGRAGRAPARRPPRPFRAHRRDPRRPRYGADGRHRARRPPRRGGARAGLLPTRPPRPLGGRRRRSPLAAPRRGAGGPLPGMGEARRGCSASARHPPRGAPRDPPVDSELPSLSFARRSPPSGFACRSC